MHCTIVNDGFCNVVNYRFLVKRQILFLFFGNNMQHSCVSNTKTFNITKALSNMHIYIKHWKMGNAPAVVTVCRNKIEELKNGVEQNFTKYIVQSVFFFFSFVSSIQFPSLLNKTVRTEQYLSRTMRKCWISSIPHDYPGASIQGNAGPASTMEIRVESFDQFNCRHTEIAMFYIWLHVNLNNYQRVIHMVSLK